MLESSRLIKFLLRDNITSIMEFCQVPRTTRDVVIKYHINYNNALRLLKEIREMEILEVVGKMRGKRRTVDAFQCPYRSIQIQINFENGEHGILVKENLKVVKNENGAYNYIKRQVSDVDASEGRDAAGVD